MDDDLHVGGIELRLQLLHLSRKVFYRRLFGGQFLCQLLPGGSQLVQLIVQCGKTGRPSGTRSLIC